MATARQADRRYSLPPVTAAATTEIIYVDE